MILSMLNPIQQQALQVALTSLVHLRLLQSAPSEIHQQLGAVVNHFESTEGLNPARVYERFQAIMGEVNRGNLKSAEDLRRDWIQNIRATLSKAQKNRERPSQTPIPREMELDEIRESIRTGAMTMVESRGWVRYCRGLLVSVEVFLKGRKRSLAVIELADEVVRYGKAETPDNPVTIHSLGVDHDASHMDHELWCLGLEFYLKQHPEVTHLQTKIEIERRSQLFLTSPELRDQIRLRYTAEMDLDLLQDVLGPKINCLGWFGREVWMRELYHNECVAVISLTTQ